MAIFYFNIFARCVDRLFLSHLQYQASSLSGKPEVFSMPQINRDRTVGLDRSWLTGPVITTVHCCAEYLAHPLTASLENTAGYDPGEHAL